MSKVISIAIRKGGVGKSTTAVNLATALHLKGFKTLLIDLEHTANATISVGINPYTLETSLTDLFTSLHFTPQDVLQTTDYGLSVLPATKGLEQVEAGMTATSIGALRPIVEPLREEFDYIIIDTPPGKSYLAASALVASNLVIIPLEPHYLAMFGLEEIMNDIQQVQKGLNRELSLFGIVPTKVQINPTVTKSILAQVEQQYPGMLLPFRMKFAIKNVAASIEGKPLVIYEPSDETAQEYFRLAEAIYEQTK
jgi:chromosome partitioning protein